MTEHYVTLFDSSFVPQGLALHHSLLNHGGDFLLWILCLDIQSLNLLQGIGLDHVRLLELSKLETPELLSVKQTRTTAEYCWTLTPWTFQWVFELEPSASRVTYVDADVFLFQSPQPIFLELESSCKSVLITEHGYAPEFDQTPTSGRFCVQFLTICRERGLPALFWWRDRCIEWCYARFENGKFGDQKYIETLSDIFHSEVHVSSHNEWFQGPWNACVFPFSKAITYHFHQLRLGPDCIVMWPPHYSIPSPTEHYLYNPYCELLVHICLQYLPALPVQRGPLNLPAEIKGLRRILRNIKSLFRKVNDQQDQYPIPRNTRILSQMSAFTVTKSSF